MTATLDDELADLRRANAELQRRLDEALAREAATAEILQVINSSPGELQPVFDILLDKAMRLCSAAFGIMLVMEGDRDRTVAAQGLPPALAEWRRNHPVVNSQGTLLTRVLVGEPYVHTLDLKDDDLYRRGEPLRRANVDLGGARTSLYVPLMRDRDMLGTIHIYRQEVRPFSENQITLLQNFAAQAVIAMENARLLIETREALDQQTATAEVLQVINSSPGNLNPVFEAILEKAHDLCGAEYGVLLGYDGERFRPIATHGTVIASAESMREGIRPGFAFGRLLLGERLIHIHDMAEVAAQIPDDPLPRALFEISGIRTQLAVPLRKNDKLLGIITANRRKVDPFSDKQIALLESFAAQAVIAMENARLITETREALEQQTATAEVLQVINSSPGDLTPVFDAMLEKALHLCEAAFGLLHTYDGERFRALAIGGVSGAAAEPLREWVADPGSALEQIVRGDRVVHIPDVVDTESYRSGVASRLKLVKLTGARTALWVALCKDDVLIGVFVIYRREVRPFSDKQIALLQNFAAQAVIAMENARLITETREALEQQTATAEVLQVINSSPGDLGPVFNAMLERATTLCESAHGALFIREGESDHFRAIPSRGTPKAFAEFLTREPIYFDPERSILAQTLRQRSAIEIADMRLSEPYRYKFPLALAAVESGGTRTLLSVPLVRDDAPVGIFQLARQEVRPFSDKQIALVSNFAAQAVIAIENVRLITETQEALEQQTATAEVLQVINSSPGDLAPVFETMLERATRLCEATHGHVWKFDGEQLHAVAVHGDSSFDEWLRQHSSVRPIPGSAADRIARGERFVHIADRREEDAYRDDAIFRGLVDTSGVRASLSVALRKDETLLGMINVYRQEVRPFSDQQIALLENFAAQAVIAMENARLITETREALEQQTATAEVLQVINSSPGDLTPVFDAILEKAHSLCGTVYGSLHIGDGQTFQAVAVRGTPEAFADLIRRPFEPGPNHPVRQLMGGATSATVINSPEYDDPMIQSAQKLSGMRIALFVPLRRDSCLLGYIVAGHPEVRPFTDKQIALLQNFAAQAVIAMENARLINETREALEQQTATAEVLQVINSSPGDLVPVFDAILEKAHALCGIALGELELNENGKVRAVAMRGVSGPFADLLRQPFAPPPGSPPARLLAGERTVQISDVSALARDRPNDPRAQAGAQDGLRTALFVPLRKDDCLLGYITGYRREAHPFSPKQIALLENFAAQAVIAMENTRLITETREALEQQTATAEVLQVINSSPGDLQPVFDAMLDKATQLCEAAFGILWLCDRGRFRAAALHGAPEPYAHVARVPFEPRPDNPLGRLLRGERLIVSADVADEESYRAGDPVRRALVDLGGAHSVIQVALVKDDQLLGSLTVYRQEVRPFSGKQIALLQNFAAQAVIAIENARLITETREALEQQTATAEVLQVINSSPGDLAPVFDAMLEKAMQLCGAAFGILWTYDGELIQAAAIRGATAAYSQFLTSAPHRPGFDNAHGRLLRGEDFVHVGDAGADTAYWSDDPLRRATVELGGARTILAVPLRKDDDFLGDIVIYRREVHPFSDKQVALLQNFAAQAVIAIENARLLDEIRQRQAELRVTFDNMADGVIMFDEDLRLAAWNRNFQQILDLPDALLKERPSYAEYLRILANRGEFGTDDIEAELSRRLADTNQELRFERTRPDGRVIEVRRNSVPDGGFVLIYSDITERKRSEAEIHAARDAAEAAYRDLKAAQANLIQAEKMASLGQLTAGIAHEIKNPLNFVNNFAGLCVELLDELKETAASAITALDEDKRAEVDETIEMLTGNLEKITEHGKRADNIVKSMLEHSRGSSGERRSVDLNGLVDEALNLAYHGGRAQDQNFNVTLERDYARGITPIGLVPQNITRVCLNLFSNGFYAAMKRQKEGGDPKFKPTLKVSTRDLGAAVEIAVRDNGIGIPGEIRDKLFQPFFTTKPTGEGTGLGLSISYDVVTQQHGGTIEVDSRVGEFTEFTVRLPRAYRVRIAEAAS